MGLDQEIRFMKLQNDFPDTCPEEMADFLYHLPSVEDPICLRKNYALQGFVYGLAKERGIPSKEALYGAYIRLYPMDICQFYALTKNPKKMQKQIGNWLGRTAPYYEWDQEQDQALCHKVIGQIAFGDIAAYFCSDW